jgi:TIR domain/YARHG domain
MAHDVFVSHSVKDKAVAEAIVARLEAESVTCWIAPRDVMPGADWGESIIDAIESSRIMILIFSQSANTSTQIKREVERAVNKGVYIIPFRVDDIPPTKSLEYFISTSQWMDAFSPPLERHLDNLAKTVKAVLKSPPLPGANVPVQPQRPPIPTPLTRPPSSRKSILIPVAIAILVIVGGAGWYLVQKKGPPEKQALSPTPVPITPAAVTPVPTLVPIPAQTPSTPPPIANARGPWLFPDSSSRYLSAAELSSLSPDNLWRARNEIFARNGYKFKTARGIAFAHTLGNYYRGVDDNQDRVFNSMNQDEKANVRLIQSIESGR